MKEYPDRINEIASEVIQDIDPKESEKYGIVTIIMIISITLTFIRIMQECEKNKTSNMNEDEKRQFVLGRIKTLSERKGWYTRMRIKKVLRQNLGKEVYKQYRDTMSNNILNIGSNLCEEDLKLLMEQI
tara:strand:+ start:511 stop:897 length:387 start_codon:yes stop_codon:yes gene_type:complete